MQTDKYGVITAEYLTKMGYYVVKYVSDAFTLHEDTTSCQQVSNAGEMSVRAENPSCIKAKKNWY